MGNSYQLHTFAKQMFYSDKSIQGLYAVYKILHSKRIRTVQLCVNMYELPFGVNDSNINNAMNKRRVVKYR